MMTEKVTVTFPSLNTTLSFLYKIPGAQVIWFIRHGKSESDAGLATRLPVDIQLTDMGKQQAMSIARILPIEPSLVITSRYTRAKQTAEPTVRMFPHVLCLEWDVHEFTYITQFHGKELSKQDRRPQVDAFWERLDPLYIDGPDGESFAAFIIRVQNVLKLLRQRQESFIAIFSHEQLITAVRWLLSTQKIYTKDSINSALMDDFRNFLLHSPLHNGSITPIYKYKENYWVGDIIDIFGEKGTERLF